MRIRVHGKNRTEFMVGNDKHVSYNLTLEVCPQDRSSRCVTVVVTEEQAARYEVGQDLSAVENSKLVKTSFPWRNSASDLATDIAYVLTRADCSVLIETLARFLAKAPEKFVSENRDKAHNNLIGHVKSVVSGEEGGHD